MEEHSLLPELRDALSHAIFRANVELWETVRQRTLGDFSTLQLHIPERDQPIPVSTPHAAPSPTGPQLSQVLPGFLDFMSKQEGWRGQTLSQNRTTYDMFVQCCGDKSVTAYQRKDLAAFYDLLRALPRLYSKSAEWRGLPLVEIAKSAKERDHERLTMTTVKRHFSALGRLFGYLKQRGEYAGENPAYGFEFPDKRRARTKRSMWQGESLTKLFSSPVWTGCFSESRRSRPGKLIIKDEKYWLPLLGRVDGFDQDEAESKRDE